MKIPFIATYPNDGVFVAGVAITKNIEEKQVKKLVCFEILPSTEFNVQNTQNSFLPNFFVEYKKTIRRKMSALGEYKSEKRKHLPSCSLESVGYPLQYKGTNVGREYAEAFILVRDIGGD